MIRNKILSFKKIGQFPQSAGVDWFSKKGVKIKFENKRYFYAEIQNIELNLAEFRHEVERKYNCKFVEFIVYFNH